MFDAVSGATANPASQAGRDRQQLNEDLNKFLTLLITQLRNQDPLEPLKPQEFTQQLVQFASVEQQIYQNNHLEQLLGAYANTQSAASVSYLGTTVEAASDKLPLQQGNAVATYTLPEASQETMLVIKDGRGTPVFTAAGETRAGRHLFEWDGRDGRGNPLPDGAYTFEVAARRRDDQAIAVTRTVLGRVDAASFDQGNTALHLGDVVVGLDDLLTVQAPPQPAPAGR
jgi:flagellar basal-body rod modification protein FlgD